MVVGFMCVGAVVAGGAKIFGKTFDVWRRDGLVTFVSGAHVHRADSAGVHCCDYRRPRWSANRIGRKGVGISAALFGEAVEIGGVGVIVAIAAKVRADIFAANPEDI